MRKRPLASELPCIKPGRESLHNLSFWQKSCRTELCPIENYRMTETNTHTRVRGLLNPLLSVFPSEKPTDGQDESSLSVLVCGSVHPLHISHSPRQFYFLFEYPKHQNESFFPLTLPFILVASSKQCRRVWGRWLMGLCLFPLDSVVIVQTNRVFCVRVDGL